MFTDEEIIRRCKDGIAKASGAKPEFDLMGALQDAEASAKEFGDEAHEYSEHFEDCDLASIARCCMHLVSAIALARLNRKRQMGDNEEHRIGVFESLGRR